MTAQSQTLTAAHPVQIEVFSDVVCPWCFIGKRRLEQALHRLTAAGGRSSPGVPQVQWRAFQLNPWLPPAGMERAEYVNRKFGSGAGGVYTRVAAVGQQVGIGFAFDRIARQPNTVDAHRLIRLAGEEMRQDAMAETLFQAYFLEGADLSSAAVLLGLAQRAGLDPQRAQACLSDEGTRDAVLDEDRRARELGVEGVPFFVFNRRLAVSGAQEPEVLLGAIERAAGEVAHS
jgi:predicted DsbA family dithiol-disulfide isomerase